MPGSEDPSGNISSPAQDSIIITLPAAVQLSETGQTLCYDEAGAPIACAATGQDGFWRAGIPWPAPRFTDNQDGSLTDRLTGNMNPQDANVLVSRDPLWNGSVDGRLTWPQSLEYIRHLNSEFYLGYNDWRLPNLNELLSLQKYQALFSDWLTGAGFLNVQTGLYWTSSTDPGTTANAYVVNDNGTTGSQAKTGTAFVFPIRNDRPLSGAVRLLQTGQDFCSDASGIEIACADPVTGQHTGQDGDVKAGIPWLSNRFTASTDLITDSQTGLTWMKNAQDAGPAGCTPGTAKTWQAALEVITCLNQNRYLGYPDWRLPNVHEFQSLANLETGDGAAWLGSLGFTGVQSDYWTGDTEPGTPANAYGIHWGSFSIQSQGKTATKAVWPVRGGYLPEYPVITEVTNGNGTLVCAPNPVPTGNPSTCTATADPNFHVASISGCGGTTHTNTSNDETTWTYATGEVQANCTVTAGFAIHTYLVDTSLTGTGIALPSATHVNHGATTQFTFTAGTGYHLTSVSGCGGVPFTNTSNGVTTHTYTTGPITGACTLSAAFAINQYTLNYSAGVNGSITGDTPQTVNHGGSGTAVTALPAAGYHFVNWSDGSTAQPAHRYQRDGEYHRDGQLCHQHLHPDLHGRGQRLDCRNQPADGQPRNERNGGNGGAGHGLPLCSVERRFDGQPADGHQRDGEYHRDGQLCHQHLHPDLHGRGQRLDCRNQPADGQPRNERNDGNGGPDRGISLRAVDGRIDRQPADGVERDGQCDGDGRLCHQSLYGDGFRREGRQPGCGNPFAADGEPRGDGSVHRQRRRGKPCGLRQRLRRDAVYQHRQIRRHLHLYDRDPGRRLHRYGRF